MASNTSGEGQQGWQVHNPELSAFPLLEDAAPATEDVADPGTYEPPEPEPEPAPAAPAASQPTTRPPRSAGGTFERRTMLGILGGVALIGGLIAVRPGSPPEPAPTTRSTRPSRSPASGAPTRTLAGLKTHQAFLPLVAGDYERMRLIGSSLAQGEWGDLAEYLSIKDPKGPVFTVMLSATNKSFAEFNQEAIDTGTRLPESTEHILIRKAEPSHRFYFAVTGNHLVSGSGDGATPAATRDFALALNDALPETAPGDAVRPKRQWPSDTPPWRQARFPDAVAEWTAIDRREDPDSPWRSATYLSPDGQRFQALLKEDAMVSNRADLLYRRRDDEGIKATGPVVSGSQGEKWLAERVINGGVLRVEADQPQSPLLVEALAKALR